MAAHRYTFDRTVEFSEVECSLLLALWTVESLHGESRVRLETSYSIEDEDRTCIVDSDTDAGVDLNRVFCGLLRREFGETVFRVERIVEPAPVATC